MDDVSRRVKELHDDIQRMGHKTHKHPILDMIAKMDNEFYSFLRMLPVNIVEQILVMTSTTRLIILLPTTEMQLGAVEKIRKNIIRFETERNKL